MAKNQFLNWRKRLKLPKKIWFIDFTSFFAWNFLIFLAHSDILPFRISWFDAWRSTPKIRYGSSLQSHNEIRSRNTNNKCFECCNTAIWSFIFRLQTLSSIALSIFESISGPARKKKQLTLLLRKAVSRFGFLYI